MWVLLACPSVVWQRVSCGGRYDCVLLCLLELCAVPHSRPGKLCFCQTNCPPTNQSPAADVVRKIAYGDVDLGIVGLDMLAEIGNDDPGQYVVGVVVSQPWGC